MTKRERLTSGGVTEAARRPTGGHEVLLRPPSPLDLEAARAQVWAEVFQSASPEVQHDLLGLARQQGLLYAHQLPVAAANGNGAGDSRHALSCLLTGNVDHLQPVHPGPISWINEHLDPAQREAVARALHTPDLCLIQGLPGTGKSSVVAEIVLQAASRGDRVLLLSLTTAALDRILELVGNHDLLCPVRCLGRDERPEDLRPLPRSFVFDERVRSLGEPPLLRAREEYDAAKAACSRGPANESVLAGMHADASRSEELERSLAQLSEQRDRVPAEVASEGTAASATAGTFVADLIGALQARDATLGTIDARLAECAAQAETLRRQQAELLPRVEATRYVVTNKRSGRWWTGDWWKATFNGDYVEELDALETEARKIQADLAASAQETQRLDQERQQVEADADVERGRRLAAEVSRRQALLAQQEAAYREEQRRLEDAFRTRCLDFTACRPTALTPQAVAAARERWQVQHQADERRLAFALRWLEFLEHESGSLAPRLVNHANLVAATVAALPHDKHFGDRSGHAVPYDLAIVQEAELISRPDLLAVARRARRCIVLGEPDGTAVAGPFATLWQALACDPRKLTCAWVLENDRLCCRLRPVAPEQRQWLESERLADRPEIELRILISPRSRPVLAEIVFPPSTSVVQAKEFIYRELEELTTSTTGASLHWTTDGTSLIASFGHDACSTTVAADLGNGVREVLCRANHPENGDSKHAPLWSSCRLEFDLSTGWQRSSAEEWVHKHLGLRDLGRSARLDVPHRMHPDLAAFVSDLLFPGAFRIPCAPAVGAAGKDQGECNGRPPAVEFVSVVRRVAGGETNGRNSRRGPARSPRAGTPKENDGLELELNDHRHLDRLPEDLRAGLPAQGFVNHLEAQAIVRTLEALVTAGGPLAVAVIALYPAQAELIRRLARRSAFLTSHLDAIEIATPAAFRQREQAVVLLSLTRSHSHRAVSFGDNPQALALALTRARARLIVFGHPGTLLRRGQWSGTVDHLDEATSAREREVVDRLARYLDGRGTFQQVFRLVSGA